MINRARKTSAGGEGTLIAKKDIGRRKTPTRDRIIQSENSCRRHGKLSRTPLLTSADAGKAVNADAKGLQRIEEASKSEMEGRRTSQTHRPATQKSKTDGHGQTLCPVDGRIPAEATAKSGENRRRAHDETAELEPVEAVVSSLQSPSPARRGNEKDSAESGTREVTLNQSPAVPDGEMQTSPPTREE